MRWREPPRPRHKYFCVPHYLRDKRAKNIEEAEAMALREAVQFRFDLVKAGKIRKYAQGAIQSGVVGVKWRPEKNAWQVGLMINGQKINGGLIQAKDESPEEVENARMIAVDKRRELERQYFDVQVTVNDATITQQRESGMAGVTWERTLGAWRARAKGGANYDNDPKRRKEINRRFFPEDLTPEAIEKSRQAAIIWLQANRPPPTPPAKRGRKRKSEGSSSMELSENFLEAKEESNEAREEINEATMAAAVGTGSASEADAVAAAEADKVSKAPRGTPVALRPPSVAADAEAGGTPEAGVPLVLQPRGTPEASMAVDSVVGGAPEALVGVDPAAEVAPEAATAAVPPMEQPVAAAS